ncbi:MAG TPA: YHS domain-containing protein [Roseiflexaceae bacterium]|nr:YHS domain-containing protein [Roseiflexaceae bacterium]
MKRDRVCGVFVDPAHALRLEYHGKTYYFCSYSCKHEFEDRPDEYADHPASMVLNGLIFEPIRILTAALEESKRPIGR